MASAADCANSFLFFSEMRDTATGCITAVDLFFRFFLFSPGAFLSFPFSEETVAMIGCPSRGVLFVWFFRGGGGGGEHAKDTVKPGREN